MNNLALKKKALSATIASYIGDIIQRLTTFFIQITLARLLTPSDFGLIAMAMVFTEIISVIRDFGLTTAIIQRNDIKKETLSSVFFLNLFTGIILSILVYTAAPIIAIFFNEVELTIIIRVLASSIFISALGSIYRTVLVKELLFKTLAKINIIANLISGVLTISLVHYFKMGAISLAFNMLAITTISTILLISFSKLKVYWHFKWSEIKTLLPFSINVFGLEVFNRVFKRIDEIFIGKLFEANLLGLFNRARNLRVFQIDMVSRSIESILFPLYSKIQDNKEEIIYYMATILNMLSFVIIPLMIMSIVFAKPVIILLLTEKWEGVIPYFQILCIGGIVSKIGVVNLSIIIAKGYSGYNFKYSMIIQVFKSIIRLSTLLISFNLFLLTFVIVEYIHFFINLIICKKFSGYKIIEQLKAIYPYFINAVAVGLISILLIPLFKTNYLYQIIFIAIPAFLTYITLSWIQKLPAIIVIGKLKNHFKN